MARKYYITYRNEFEAEVEADSREEAIKKFQNNECEISCCGELWDEYFEVNEDDQTNSCDKCKEVMNTNELVWLTAEDFEPKPNEIVPKELYKKYDCLCEECYLKLIKQGGKNE